MFTSDHLDSTEQTMRESGPAVLRQASIGNGLLGQARLPHSLVEDDQSAAPSAKGALGTPLAHYEAILNLIIA